MRNRSAPTSRLHDGLSVLVALAVLSCTPQTTEESPRVTRFRLSTAASAPCRPPADPASALCADPEGQALGDLPWTEKIEEIEEIDSPARGRSPLAFSNLDRVLAYAGSSLKTRQQTLERIRHRADQAPGDPALRADLAIARWYLAERLSAPAGVLEALADFEAARKLAPWSTTALFNRATWLGLLGLTDEAQLTWQRYLAQETEEAWRAEALRHLAALQRPDASDIRPRIEHELSVPGSDLLTAFPPGSEALPQVLREITQETDIHSWLKDHHREASPGGRLVSALGRLGGSPLLADCRARLKQLPEEQRPLYIDAHQTFSEGFEAYLAGDLKQAKAFWRPALASMERLESPFRYRLRSLIAVLDYYTGKFELVYRDLEDLLDEPALERYPALRARCHWIMGLCRGKQGDLLAYSRHLRESLSLFGQAEEPGNQAVVLSYLAEATQELGQSHHAWSFRLKALSRLPSVPNKERRHNILYEMADTLLLSRRPELALPFLDQMVTWASASADPMYATEARTWRARTLFQLNRNRAALNDLSEVETLIERLPEDSLTQRLLADVEWILGTDTTIAPETAVEHLRAAEELYSRSEDLTRIPDLMLDRAAIHRQLLNVPAAIEDLSKGIEVFETLRRDLPELDLRISYFDRARDLFDALLPLLLDEGKIDEAWRYSERSKARVLKDLAASGRTLSRDELRLHISEHAAVLEFVSLEHELLLWILKYDTQHLFRLPVTQRELSELTRALTRSALANSTDSALKKLDDLYRRLIQPAYKELEEIDTWIVVPDKALYRVPFDSLRTNGRFMFETHTIAVAPSATLWLGAKQALARHHGAPKHLLSVGVGELPEEWNLEPLAMAEPEAREVSELYPSARVLIGKQATPDTFRSALEHAEVLHLATHAVINPEYPLFSFLAMGSDSDSSDSPGPLYAHQLYQLKASALRLAVLAACQTAGGRISLTEGPHSLARPFLAQGVPNVLATLWGIDDTTTSVFLPEFHRRLRQGRPPAGALRDTKLFFLERDGQEAVTTLAAFQMLGTELNLKPRPFRSPEHSRGKSLLSLRCVLWGPMKLTDLSR